MSDTPGIDAAELIEIQFDLCHRLQSAYKNYKKSPKDRLKRPYIEARLHSLEELNTQFKTKHREIISVAKQELKESSIYFTEDRYEWFEEEYINYKAHLTADLELALKKPEETPKESNISTDVKLPRIQLPTFSGKYEEWQTFYDMFTSVVHSNDKISSVQKLHYLKSSLSGEAENLLRNLSTTDQNYTEAWKQLTKRYNNKRYNCNAIFKNLFSLKPIQNESATAVKNLLDTTTSSLKALNNLGIKTATWDAIIVYFVVSKLDVESRKQWENHLSFSTEDLPTWVQLTDFLEARFRSLEVIDSTKHVTKPMQPNNKQAPKRSFHLSLSGDNKKEAIATCVMCNGQHLLHQCQNFCQQSVSDKKSFVQSKGLCFNCLSSSHIVGKCRQPSCCKKCGRRHHTMLHVEKEGTSYNEAPKGETTDETTKQPSAREAETKFVANFAKKENMTHNILLATAVVKVDASNGRKHYVRALLDQGSQASFITKSTVQLLGLKITPVNGVVSGLGDGQKRIKQMVSLRLEARHNPEISIRVNAYVLGSLTSMIPSEKVEFPKWLVLKNLELADPEFTSPGKIDLLLGAEVYSEVLSDGLLKDPQGNLIAQSTVLGWVLSGKTSNKSHASYSNIVSMHVRVADDDMIRKFWEMEAEPNSIQKRLSKEEHQCEELYDKTTVRNKDGRFVVKLPFKNEDPECQYGQSQDIAVRKLRALERRLVQNPVLYDDYRKVLDEYVELKHMAPVKDEDIDNPKAVYLPHHAVVRADKQTTKLRVVFNASSKVVNGVSLNDDLLVGPKLQQDLRHILMRWRTHRVCIIADLVKMYRQVLVSEDDTNYQRILWRPNPEMPIKHFKLLTLTFGTASAPYLAVKTVQRLAEEEITKYPTAAEIAKGDYYVDDLLTGCDSEIEAQKIITEMCALMGSGGFQLQKWSSNSDSLLNFIGEGHQGTEQSIPIKADNTVTVLGIQWNRDTDNFEYTVNLPELKSSIDKRQVLSDIARLYDPMGWIAPIVISAKILIQKIWKAQVGWDDPLPNELLAEWVQYRDELKHVKNIIIPRWLHCTPNCNVELHAFSDAPRAAFAAAVYSRVVDSDGNVHVSLVSAKTKVAPIQKELSIPRLELCGAALAAKLLSEISQVMNIPKDKLFAWTDSTVVLAWLKGGASKWTTFVSNRVSEILTILDYDQWGHVTTDLNPSDCASRGLRPAELRNDALWWTAPAWLWESKVDSKKPEKIETKEEERLVTMTVTEQKEEEFIWTKFSDLTKMLRVISYCKRIRMTKEERKDIPKFITPKEMKETLQSVIKRVQELEYGDQIHLLKNGSSVPRKSVLHTLCPFLDENGILRVGGRISQAHVSYDKRHPIIMPAKSHLTQLLIIDAHYRTLHGGPQLMLNFLRTKYWIIRAREQVKKHFRKCVTCLRHSNATKTQLMGQIPEVRLKPSRPFKSTGVDYAGPINIRFSPGLGAKSYKGYICLMVCMVTRAIHLEAVTDLTAKGFIAAFKRFTARRGHCQDIFSDNGTNFVGADKQLRELFDRAKSSVPSEIAEALSLQSTTWHFIPPYAPNFGGLWEAGVRSAKTHLKKVIGDSSLTYEELTTLLAQVEACLNSRPLTVFSEDPNDPLPLTPGHFLVGESLLNVTEDDLSDQNITGLDRWKLVQKMLNDFWKRWSKEYLTSLHQRYKWNTKKPEPDINNIVIVKDDNLPPCKWILGRIIDKHIGPDNVTRVVTIKCKNGTIKRPVSKLIIFDK